MPKIFDEITMVFAAAVAAVLFLMGVRSILRDDESIARRGKFALYVALVLAFLGLGAVHEARAESPNTKIKKDTYKSSADWKQFKKFWHEMDAAERGGGRTPDLQEALTALQNMAMSGMIDKETARYAKRYSEMFYKDFRTRRTPSRSMPAIDMDIMAAMDRRLTRISSRAENIDRMDRTTPAFKKNREDFIKQMETIAESYDPGDIFYRLIISFTPMTGWRGLDTKRFFKEEKDSLKKLVKRDYVKSSHADLIIKKLDALKPALEKVDKFLKGATPELERVKAWQDFCVLWNDISHASKEYTVEALMALQSRLDKQRNDFMKMADAEIIDRDAAFMIYSLAGRRIEVLAGDRMRAPVARMTMPEVEYLNMRRRIIERYEATIDAIFKLNNEKKVDEAVLKKARENAEKVFAEYGVNVILARSLWSRIGFSIKSPFAMGPAKTPQIPVKEKTPKEIFEETYAKLKKMLSEKKISQLAFDKNVAKLKEGEATLYKMLELGRKLHQFGKKQEKPFE